MHPTQPFSEMLVVAAFYTTNSHTEAHKATLNLEEKRRSISFSCVQVDCIISSVSDVPDLGKPAADRLATVHKDFTFCSAATMLLGQSSSQPLPPGEVVDSHTTQQTLRQAAVYGDTLSELVRVANHGLIIPLEASYAI